MDAVKGPTFRGSARDWAKEATRLAECGFRVIPINGKKPLIADWVRSAPKDPAKVYDLFKRGQINNESITGIGIVLDNPIVVVDFDPRNSGYDLWEDYDLPETVVCHTGGGGRHYYYRLSGDIKAQCKKIENGVDLKAYGGFVVAPPSLHPSGEQYVWEVGAEPWNRPIAPAPAWLVEEIRGRGELAYKTKPPIGAGFRHNYLVSLAGALCSCGVDGNIVDAILRDVYEQYFEKGDFDIERELKNLQRYYPKWQGQASLKSVLGRLPKEVREIVSSYIKPHNNEQLNENGLTRRERLLNRAIKALGEAHWVEWGNMYYVVMGNLMLHPDDATVYLRSVGVNVSSEIAREAVREIINTKRIRPLEGIIVGDFITVGEVNGIKGLWHHYEGTLFCHTTEGIRQWPEGEWPQGVYCMPRRAGSMGVPYVEGDIEDLLKYMWVAGNKIQADLRVITAMLMPILLGDGDAGFILTGPAGTGKSTFGKALAYLERGREWYIPVGSQIRDYVASLASNRITFFDDAGFLKGEIQDLLRSKITHSGAQIRRLYEDGDLLDKRLAGSMIVCTTAIDGLSHDLADRCFYIRFGEKGPKFLGDQLINYKAPEDEIIRYFRETCHKARGGLIKLWLESQKVSVPEGLLPEVRFVHWLRSAYRAAVVLGVQDEFVKYVRTSKLQALESLKYAFILDALDKGLIEEGKPYRLKDIWQLVGNDPEDYEVTRLARGLGSGQKNKREVETIAKALNYSVTFTKMVIDTKTGARELVMIFSKEDNKNVISNVKYFESLCPYVAGNENYTKQDKKTDPDKPVAPDPQYTDGHKEKEDVVDGDQWLMDRFVEWLMGPNEPDDRMIYMEGLHGYYISWCFTRVRITPDVVHAFKTFYSKEVFWEYMKKKCPDLHESGAYSFRELRTKLSTKHV